MTLCGEAVFKKLFEIPNLLFEKQPSKKALHP
jgi:hypothetical protein